jgi:hypothetical protein
LIPILQTGLRGNELLAQGHKVRWQTQDSSPDCFFLWESRIFPNRE